MRGTKLIVVAACALFACSGSDVLPPSPLAFTTERFVDGTVGQPYTQLLEASGGDGAYTWSITAGGLPPGLSFLGASIVGTPLVVGTSTLTLQVKDRSDMVVQREFTIAIARDGDAPLVILTPSVPDGVVGDAYEASLAAQGGDGSYRWSVASGSLPPGLTLSEEGGIAGVPTAAGTFMVQARVQDGVGQIDVNGYSITVTETPIALSVQTTMLEGARLDISYVADVRATGGSNVGYSWSLASGALPPGLSFSPVGTPGTRLQGTPSAVGRFTFELAVIDSLGAMASQTFELAVSDGLSIDPPVLDPAVAGTPYMATLAAVGGTGTMFGWSLAAGSQLPPGLQLVEMGDQASLEGTIAIRGTYDFRVELNSDASETASIAYTLEVREALAIATQTLSAATLGVPYNQTIRGTGGTGRNYSWTLSAGPLPPGLTLDPNGTPDTFLTGTPTMQGDFPITINLRDPSGQSVSASFSLTVIGGFTIVPTQIPDRAICTAGATTLSIGGGSAPYTWSVLAGSLPNGWLLEPSQTAQATISGRGVTAGASNFTIVVTDNNGMMASQSYAVNVTDDPNAQRLMVASGDMTTDNDNEVFVFDICGDTPSMPTRWNPAAPGLGDVSATADLLAFSPSGDVVAFVGDFTTDGLNDLYVFDPTGVAPTAVNITNFTQAESSVQDFYWSPNGSFIAYTADPNLSGSDQLFFVDLRNRNTPGSPVLISQGLAGLSDLIDVSANDVFWSPNSQRIVFHGDLDVNGVNELYYANVGNPAVPFVGVKIHAPLTGSQDCEDDVLWAPDSSGVLYRCDIAATNQDELWFTNFNLAPTTAIRVNNPGYGPDNDVGFADYAFNAAGTMAYYLADELNNGSEEIWIVPFASGAFGTPHRAIIPLASFETVSSAKWNPTSSRIAFRSDRGADDVFNLFIADIAATPVAHTQVSQMPAAGDIDISSTPGFAYEWSHDGTRIAFVGDQAIDGVDRLYVANLSLAPPFTVADVSPAVVNTAFDVSQFFWSPNDQWIAYRGDFNTDSAFDLYVTDVSRAPPYLPQQVSLPLPLSGDVVTGAGSFAFRRDSSGLFFEADMVTNNDNDFWSVDLSTGAPTPPARINTALPMSGDMYVFYLQP